MFTILLVEFDDPTRDVVASMLEALGYAAVPFKFYSDALKSLGNITYDLMLYGSAIYDVDESNVIDKAVLCQRGLRTIVMSGCRIDRALEKACDTSLLKPFTIASLDVAIKSVCPRGV